MIEARFDDLLPGRERSFRFIEPVGVIEARSPGEVGPALDALESAAARGLWAAGFLAYEAAPGLNPSLVVRTRTGDDPLAGLPLLWFAMFEGRAGVPPFQPVGEPPLERDGSPWRASIDRGRFDSSVARIREHISAGDTYQVNFTIRLRARIEGDERDFYRDLCLGQRGAYAAYLNAGRYRVLSASPELFFRMEGERIATRPMKGTASRGRWTEEDEDAGARLAASPKDRAENAMIVDLLRSDLGRISETGSVRVERMFEAERYETVWQLTSTIASGLRPGTTLAGVFRALFPSGSVTGAPKVATMRLIAGLEDSPRGVYCGAVGYLAPSGSGEPRANFNVAIRTVVFDAETRLAEYGVGGGITHDSSAAGEFDEVVAKARVLTTRRPPFELFETLRHEAGAGFRHLAEHLARLEGSARYFGFRFDPGDANDVLEKAVADLGGGDGRVRLSLSRDGAFSAESSPLSKQTDAPARVALHPDPVDPSDVWLFHKTTRREAYERRRADRPDVDDVVLMNVRSEVTESTIANLAVRLSGAWVTPPLDCGVLPGTFRAVLLREGRLRERPVRADELGAAEGLALVSSVRGWRDAVLVP